MKKFKKILAGSLTALSFAGNFRAHAKDKIQDSKIINEQPLNLSDSKNKNKFLDFVKNNKGKIIGVTAGVAALGTTYGLGREGIYNGLFPGSNKVLYYRVYSDAEIEKREKKAIQKGLERIELKTDWGATLRGFARFPKNIDKKDVKKIILVFGGNAELSCVSVDYASRRAAEDDKKNAVFVCFDYPTYGKSEGPTLSQKVLQKYAESVLSYANKLKSNEYVNSEISTYGYSLGGYSASYLSKEKEVKEVSLWSPVVWNAAVQGLTGMRWLGTLGRYLAFGGAEFDFIENIKNSHENCKINLFSGSLAAGDFLSLETSVFEGKKYNGQITDNKYLNEHVRNIQELECKLNDGFKILYAENQQVYEEALEEDRKQKQKLKDEFFSDRIKKDAYKKIKNWEKIVAREAYRKLAKEGKNNLGNRLTVSFSAIAGHCDKDFNDEVWNYDSVWDKNKEDK